MNAYNYEKGTMTPYHRMMNMFKAHAFKLGYREKVVGDDAYTKRRTPQSPIIRLIGGRNGRIQIFETGKGRYEI
jgi:hypothetical protein